MHLGDELYDNQRRRDYERNLTHLKNKKRLKTKEIKVVTERNWPKSMLLNTSRQELQTPQVSSVEKPKHKVKVQDLKTLLNKMTARNNIKQFIKKLKQYTKHSQKAIQTCQSFQMQNLEERINRDIQRSKLFSLLKLQGLTFSNTYNLAFYLVTFFTLFYINLLSTFHCFLAQFRQNESYQLWVNISQIYVILVIIIKIISSCLIQKNVNGYKLNLVVDIAKRYIFSFHSLIDLLLLISVLMMLIYNYRVTPAVFVYFISLIRIIALERIDDAFARHLLLNFKTKQYYSLFRLILANFFLAHLCGSIFLAVAAIQQNPSWMTYNNNYQRIYEASWFQKYIFSVYWASTIMTTVGFGDITPCNSKEAFVSTIVMLFGCLILSYNINQVSNIFNNLMDRRDELQAQLFNLNVLSNIAKIDQNLHRKIADYLINSFQIKFKYQEQEAKELLAKLPENLKEQFIEQNSRNFFSQMPFFYILKSETKTLLIEQFNMGIYPPNQHITRNGRNKHGFRKVFALRFGEVGLAYKKRGAQMNGHIIDKINVKTGDLPLLLNAFLLSRKQKLNYSIICSTFCNIMSLEFDDMRKCLQEVPYDFQLWRQYYDSDKFLTFQLGTKSCQFCDQYHTKFNCPKLVYMPLRAIIYRKNTSQKHDDRISTSIMSSTHIIEMMREHFTQIRQRKRFAKKTPLKFWKRLFAPLQRSQFLSIQRHTLLKKNQTNPQSNKFISLDDTAHSERIKQQKRKVRQGNKYKIRQFVAEQHVFDVDVPYDFQNYFAQCNPKKLVKIDLVEYEIPQAMYRMASN